MTTVVKKTSSTTNRYYCDFCAVESKGVRCSMCGKDICKAHRTYDPQDYSDNPEKYCPNCWNLSEREAFYEYKTESELKLDELEEAWKTKARGK